MLATKMKELSIERGWEIIADSAEPKSIQEIANYTFNIIPAEKGPDSIRAGINTLKRHKLNVTKGSVGLRKELSRYKWAVDKDGKSLNKPIDVYNHAIDALRYLALNKLMIEGTGQYSFM
jgi:phage terminase large subunit